MLSERDKKEQKLINTNVITIHNGIVMSRDIAMSRDKRSSFSLIQTYLLFPVFNL